MCQRIKNIAHFSMIKSCEHSHSSSLCSYMGDAVFQRRVCIRLSICLQNKVSINFYCPRSTSVSGEQTWFTMDHFLSALQMISLFALWCWSSPMEAPVGSLVGPFLEVPPSALPASRKEDSTFGQLHSDRFLGKTEKYTIPNKLIIGKADSWSIIVI